MDPHKLTSQEICELIGSQSTQDIQEKMEKLFSGVYTKKISPENSLMLLMDIVSDFMLRMIAIQNETSVEIRGLASSLATKQGHTPKEQVQLGADLKADLDKAKTVEDIVDLLGRILFIHANSFIDMSRAIGSLEDRMTRMEGVLGVGFFAAKQMEDDRGN